MINNNNVWDITHPILSEGRFYIPVETFSYYFDAELN